MASISSQLSNLMRLANAQPGDEPNHDDNLDATKNTKPDKQAKLEDQAATEKAEKKAEDNPSSFNERITSQIIEDHFLTKLMDTLHLKSIWDYVINDKKDAVGSLTAGVLNYVFNKLPKHAALVAAAGNVIGGTLELFAPGKVRSYVEKINTFLTRFSFVPYGLDGIRNGIKKKNFYQAIAFLGEPIFAFMGNLKDIYLMRGLPTGLDQIPVATEQVTKKKFGGKSSFPTWFDGLREVPLAALKLLEDLVRAPLKTLITTETGGHHALLSSLGSMFATVLYLTSGTEKIAGPLRDWAGFLVDYEMIFHENPRLQFAGWLFVAEEVFDFSARYVPERFRLCLNQFSHACGRLALENYKEAYNDDLKAQERDQAKGRNETQEEAPT